ncbi:MAG: hypothetical protein K2N21_01760 [Rikenellaceae bacterium]|nr:hypothetical protein [Rikenellaceae bacterium]
MKISKLLKQPLLLLLAVLTATACNKGEIEFGEFGVFEFNEIETIIYIDKDTKSFKLTGHYLKDADPEYDGWIFPEFMPQSSTAIDGKHFVNDQYAKFSKGENGNYYLDVTIFPDNITEEVKLEYFVSLTISDNQTPDMWPQRIDQTTIILRPAK